MKKIPAGKFKAECLALLDRVRDKHEVYLVTKHGKPVAKLVPVGNEVSEETSTLEGSIVFEGDLISPIDTRWESGS